MKLRTIFFSAAAALLLATPLLALAGQSPDFNADAKPILRHQPNLLTYVKTNFDVQETGYSKVPGDENHPPPPPYIFRARPHGSHGPYNITLLIQPGPPGHILLVHPDAGANPVASQPAPPPLETTSSPVQTAPPSGPTSATPSGPIHLSPPAQ